MTNELRRKRIAKTKRIIARLAVEGRYPGRKFTNLEVDLMLEEIAAALAGREPKFAEQYRAYGEPEPATEQATIPIPNTEPGAQ